jgi:hypothetical protein
MPTTQVRREGHEMSNRNELIPTPNYEIISESGVKQLLLSIRPYWQGKKLIERVERLLPADPSSACQRIFNASIHDLREKLVIAGIDIVTEAAKQNKLPPINLPEDIEQYSTYNIIDLSYRVGLLSRAESRRLFRAYEIRGDLEHEDDEYEATIEDCVYIFNVCINNVLSRDPVQILKLTDIKTIVEQPQAIVLGEEIIEDFHHAPDIRQNEIYRFLISYALDIDKPDIIRQNCYTALLVLRPFIHDSVVVNIAIEYSKSISRNGLDQLHTRVAFAAGLLPYLKKVQINDYYNGFLARMSKVGYSFVYHSEHGELLRNFKEVGGLTTCPPGIRVPILEWLILCYIGEPGGYGAGVGRPVFYSNVGAPLAFDLIKDAHHIIEKDFQDLISKKNGDISKALVNKHIERRLDQIQDIFMLKE